MSSALNSPDPSNRLEYVTSYVDFYPYSYPSNGNIVLEDEFWRRFRAYQLIRSPAERVRSRDADLDKVWHEMRARFENVETTVQQTPLVIAQVTREVAQNVENSNPSPPLNSVAPSRAPWKPLLICPVV